METVMGWIRFSDGDDDDWSSEHHGYVQGVVRDGWSWRDLSLDDTAVLTSNEFHIQVACSCGWRTQRMTPPWGAEWAPCSVYMSQAWEDEAHSIWSAEHRDSVTGQFRHLPSPPISR